MKVKLTRPEAVTVARDMRAGGWSYSDIARHLADFGVDVHRSTVKRWADPDYASEQRTRTRAYQRQWKRGQRGSSIPRVVDENAITRRAHILSDAGMDPRNVGIVLRVDYGIDVSTHAVGVLLETGEMTTSLREAIRA